MDILMVVGAATLGFAITTQALSAHGSTTVDHFTKDDEGYADHALKNLHSGDTIRNVADADLHDLHEQGKVIMAKHPKRDSPLAFSHPVNNRYWPYYYYTYPYQYTEGGAWPPNMYSRLRNWQPGYDTAGWSYWMRPGISYARWPRNRWVHNNGSYYFINNGKDRSKDYL
jgi:hypothetical protein